MESFDNKKFTEEYLLVQQGRVDAVVEYILKYPYSLDREILLAMLGRASVAETPKGDDW